ncbi:DUF937 domain-containing protein [Yinghuangia soli]|uniref:DUF937 domain-containing protein n=1 Tax=Yinghuangia soli TaxID=2908204 RepID=A0AA41PXW4_9ACTN|nr:DUF937 domain-containing protein [Yinghuangia soli]MCF2527405.1 DUF937 domain-containing protein [Yinghuangia soli]
MRGRSLADEVLKRLGDERLGKIAGALGVDQAQARKIVQDSVPPIAGALADDAVRNKTEATRVAGAINEAMPPGPAHGFAAGGAGRGRSRIPLAGIKGGILALVIRKVAGPAARRIAKKTGLPAHVAISLAETLLPVVIAVLAKRLKARNSGKGIGAVDVGGAIATEAALPPRAPRRGLAGLADRITAALRR